MIAHLLQLNLNFNDIGDDGAKFIAEALRVNASLTSVHLDEHPLPIKQLKGTDPVASIDLSGKRLTHQSATIIAELIKANVSASLTQALAFLPTNGPPTHVSAPSLSLLSMVSDSSCIHIYIYLPAHYRSIWLRTGSFRRGPGTSPRPCV